MNTFKIKNNLTKAITYMEMVEVLRSRNEAHFKDVSRLQYNDFGNIKEHYIKRISINLKMISRMENRAKQLINQSK
jgi:hypothetical protein